MARLRMRLIRNTHSGRASVSGSRSAHRHDLAGREIVGIRNWVLGEGTGDRSGAILPHDVVLGRRCRFSVEPLLRTAWRGVC